MIRGNHLIGLIGPNASGKGEVAEYLKKKGYQVYSLSDILREEAKKVGLDQSRGTLINFGYQLRKRYGEGILVKRLLKQIPNSKFVIDSIRNPGEIEELRKLSTSPRCAVAGSTIHYPPATICILGIDAPEKLRYQRLLKRKRLGDIKNFSEFVQAEKRENSNKKYAQQIGKCMQLADKIIINNSSLKQLYQKIDTFLKELKTDNEKTKN
ncbi:MAG TPA: hypothetical protein DHV62_00220 [Elusimicrobia bacterium]|nr:hypothetical protein [Elusimicrobiota bacterium]